MVKKKFIGIINKIATIILSIATFVLLDVSMLLKKILLFTDIEKILVVMDLIIKVILIAFIIVIGLYINYMLVGKKLYSDEEIVKYISRYKNLRTVILFGFSLSFAESLRLYLSKHKMEEVEVTIFLPSEKFITKRIIESTPLDSRIYQLKGRLCEWEELRDKGMIKRLIVKRFYALPVANGTILNNEKCFLFTYNWELEGDKVHFTKLPRKERLKVLIDKNEKEIWKYLMGNICCYEELSITYNEQER